MAMDVSDLHSSSGLFGCKFVCDSEKCMGIMSGGSRSSLFSHFTKSEFADHLGVCLGLSFQTLEPCHMIPCMKQCEGVDSGESEHCLPVLPLGHNHGLSCGIM